ncbi:seven-hairpin glycosidase [Thozetella sp. PMI_491]|nr:seven-hairpin glycosidase [Thozetella sp. PMI_491]
MLRFRRYRVFIIGAIVLTVLLYHVSRNSQWEPLPSKYEQTKSEWETPKSPAEHATPLKKPPPQDAADSGHKKEQSIKIPQLKTEDEAKGGGYALPNQTPPPAKPHRVQDVDPDERTPAKATPTTTPDAVAPATVPDGRTGSSQNRYGVSDEDEEQPVRVGKRPGAYQGVPLSSTSSVQHWEKPTELYPVDELIRLPTGKPKAIPRIQFRFGSESPEESAKRESRLGKVKAEAKKAWLGYKKYAWTHDEVMPVSLKSRDPFCGWAATLVDALDTLWIMGLQDEFDDAVQAVKSIDFTTTPYRSDIPVFETTIRYLGGLLAAYDVSGGRKGKYSVLLDKAVELAEILMGVFDTPNRMPILYYNWKPGFRGQHMRASSSASIAELGSLTMEFTHLAQLTGEDKYYDAVARITDALEEWQERGTTLSGLFPESVDASGCNRSAAALASLSSSSDLAQDQAKGATDLDDDPRGYVPKAPGQKARPKSTEEGESSGAPPASSAASQQELSKRDKDSTAAAASGMEADARGNFPASKQPKEAAAVGRKDGAKARTTTPNPYDAKGRPVDWDCVPQGLTSGGYGYESYSMGGSQDSTYEYFPKTWLLLGGLEPKYQTLHEKVSRGVKKHLLYRPMVEDERDILFSAKARVNAGSATNLNKDYEVTHLTCFLGGMFGLGGKIFENEDDVEVGKKLADGCVWAYEMMPTGVMPEASIMLPCPKADKCHWNQTAWYEHLDPNAEWRQAQMEDYLKQKEEWKQKIDELQRQRQLKEQQLKHREDGSPMTNGDPIESPTQRDSLPGRSSNTTLGRREVVDDTLASAAPAKASSDSVQQGSPGAARNKVKMLEDELDMNAPSGRPAQSHYGGQVGQVPISELSWPEPPKKPTTHEEYVESRLRTEHLPPGMVTLNDRRYILRPEAIESVWYMYRITGDPIWQEKGWRMFEAVIKATQTKGGHSAIDDVSLTGKPRLLDNMESFWIAETLKYFYLLFETPDVISLDEWVFNTEAHPFKRPV